MMYYNPTADVKKSRTDLAIEYNCSIPNGIEKFNSWYKLYENERPTPSIYQIVITNPIVQIEGKYTQTYNLEYKSLEDVKAIRLEEISKKFDEISETAHVMSSCGFMIDANEKANRDIEGLLKVMNNDGTESELFRDYNNEFHAVTLKQLQVMQIEVIKNGQYIYKQKWQFCTTLEALQNVEDVIAMNIEYNNLSFA